VAGFGQIVIRGARACLPVADKSNQAHSVIVRAGGCASGTLGPFLCVNV
jgi:hypothetical protein